MTLREEIKKSLDKEDIISDIFIGEIMFVDSVIDFCVKEIEKRIKNCDNCDLQGKGYCQHCSGIPTNWVPKGYIDNCKIEIDKEQFKE